MSARGELFVTEDVQDGYRKQIDRAFGKGKWRLSTMGYCHLYDEREFPDAFEIDVMTYIGSQEIKIGTIEASVHKYVSDDGYGASIEVKCEGIKIYDLNGKIIRLKKATGKQKKKLKTTKGFLKLHYSIDHVTKVSKKDIKKFLSSIIIDYENFNHPWGCVSIGLEK